MTDIYVNVGERVIEPFWDRRFCSLRKWEIVGIPKIESSRPWWELIPQSHYVKGDGILLQAQNQTGLEVSESWDGVRYKWAVAPKEAVLDMSREYNMVCGEYDRIILSAQIPLGTSLHLMAYTDQGEKIGRYEDIQEAHKNEYILELDGAERLDRLRIQIFGQAGTGAGGHFQWIMFQNTELVRKHLESQRVTEKQWEPWLKGEEYDPVFKPSLGIFADQKQLEQIKKAMTKAQMNAMVQRAVEAPEPEEMISDFVNFGLDKRFARARDFGKNLVEGAGIEIALAGLLTEDRVLLRKAARYALSLGFSDHWQDSFMCRCLGVVFEHKGFVQSLSCRLIATLLDLTGEMFTELGREFLVRRLGEEGLANINWIIWKYSKPPEDIFAINQLAWFSWGRIPAYVVLENQWPKAKPYTELAYGELCESLERIILPDGSYDEGPGYFTAVARMIGEALYWYARSRQLPLEEVIPEGLYRTWEYAECFVSLDETYDFIPVGDAPMEASPERYRFLAQLMPHSHWALLYLRAKGRQPENTTDVFALLTDTQIPYQEPKYRAFFMLPDLGAVSSVRKIGDSLIKIFQCGGRANANHGHKDKGSFVIQVGGETVAADPGIGNYDHSVGSTMGQSLWHNVLLPMVEGKQPEPIEPPVDVKPIAKGDQTLFDSRIDVTPCWQQFFGQWQRALVSHTPEVLEIVDTYELIQGRGVVFNLVTLLEVEIGENIVVIQGKASRTTITLEEGCRIRKESMPTYKGKTYQRIMIEKEGIKGTLKTLFHFEVLSVEKREQGGAGIEPGKSPTGKNWADRHS